MSRVLKVSSFALLLGAPAMPGLVQSAALAQQAPAAAPAPVQPAPAYTVQQPQAVVWQRGAAEELLAYVEALGAHGLDPTTYAPDRLRQAIGAGNDAALSSTATETFLRLTADLSGGAVRGDSRGQWFMPDVSINGNQQQTLLARASQGGVAQVLDSLHPTHPQYAGLQRALAQTPAEETARRELIRANMERWRWLPRELGARHVLVNVPAFTAAIIDNGQVTRRHRTVVGTRRTQTPGLSATVTGVTMNPWWTVPQSIIREMGGRFGSSYVVTRNGGTTIARQRPGPGNSLGRVKIEMPNDHAIFLHDTPAQALFNRPVRAFSHGCVRTQNVRDFAATLLEASGEWDRARIDATIAEGETVQARLATPIPVYIAYFTAAATNDGNIVTYADIYGRDTAVRQALNGGRRAAATAS